MKIGVLILMAGLATVILSSCAPLPRRTQLLAPVCSSTDGTLTLNPVSFLVPGYSPQPPYNTSPTIDTTHSPNSDIQSDLTAAFKAAPPSFKQQLCSLDAVYINPTGCSGYDPSTCNVSDQEIAEYSWGYRGNPSGRYIAISLGLWKNNVSCPAQQSMCAPSFQTYQTRLIQALLQTLSPKAKYASKRPRFVSVMPDAANTPAMTVLATLAHEYGHIFWYDAFVVDPDTGKPNPGGPLVTAKFCGGNFYPPMSWSYPIDLPPGRWIGFGEILNQSNKADDADVLQLPGLLAHGHFSDAGDHLNKIYRNGRWASALASFSPDEEFVETFELFVLVNANTGLQSLTIEIPGTRTNPYRDDILDNLNSATELGRRYQQCFGGNLSQFRRQL